MSTMKKVAEAAGVSISTVSHVINKSRNVNEETLRKVQSAIDKLDYQPNSLAASLRKRSTKTIGVFIADLNNDSFMDLLRLIEDNVYRYGYNTILCHTYESPEKERFYLELMVQKQIDGLILIPTCQNSEFIHRLWKKKLPMVFVDRYIPGIDAPYVGMSNYRACCLATEHLLNKGAKTIHMLYSLPSLTAIVERKDGFRETMRSHDIDIDDSAYVEFRDVHDDSEVSQVLHERYHDSPLPDAFIAASNKLALDLVHYLKGRGPECLKRTRVLGFGMYNWARDFTPSLDIVKSPNKDMAWIAVERLMDQMMNRPSAGEKRTILPCKMEMAD